MATMNLEKNMYEVYCTECGSLIKEKYFPLNNLLKLYFNGKTQEDERSRIIGMLGVGAMFGGIVLPSVPPLLEKVGENEKYRFNRPDLNSLQNTRSCLRSFSCEDGDLPKEKMVPVELNIASIVAQFCLNNGSELLYDMLERYYDLDWNQDGVADDDDLNGKCEQLALLLKDRMSAMSQRGNKVEEIRQNLQTIIDFAKTEAERDNTRHFSQESEIRVGWWYKAVNGRAMPYRLAVVGSTGAVYHCTECCCDKCHSALPCELGAYRQKIVGILGTQSTGKTTYQTALADAIDRGEATSVVEGNGVTRQTRISIQPNMVDDPQWAQAKRAPAVSKDKAAPVPAKEEDESGAGPLWLYQHGYPVEKTPDQMHAAVALTFLISSKDSAAEPVMYTLADIPGEAFTKSLKGQKDTLQIEREHALLKQSDALIMVISSRQLQDRQDCTADETQNTTGMVRSPSEMLNCYKSFLPDRAVPTAVVMTASDEINGGSLRRPMQLAFDQRKTPALVWSERKGELLYNAEQMRTVSDAVQGYIDRKHGGFIHDLYNVLKEKRGNVKLAAFAVSSGTQCAPVDYVQVWEPDYHKPERCERRHEQMIEARFGVVTPLLWLLACDDLIPVGRADTAYNEYPENVQKEIEDHLRMIL